MTWLQKTVSVIRDVVVVVAIAVGAVALMRWLTRGKWPRMQQDGSIAKPPTSSDLPSTQDCEDWLRGNTTKVLIGLLLSGLILSHTWTLRANSAFVTNAVKGMYEYSQLLEGTSVDSISNILQLPDGKYKIWFRMQVLKWPPEDKQYRTILRGIPVRFEHQVQSGPPWLWIIGSFVVGGLIGYGVAK